jgi:hypothetical protein
MLGYICRGVITNARRYRASFLSANKSPASKSHFPQEFFGFIAINSRATRLMMANSLSYKMAVARGQLQAVGVGDHDQAG